MASKKLTASKRGGNSDKLNAQQQLFIEAYFACGMSAVKAAKKVGYVGYNAGTKLLANKTVKAIIQRRMHDMLDEYHSETERIVYELENIAFANPQNILREDGSVIPLQEMDQRVARSISRMKVSYVDGGFDPNGNPITATNVDISYYDKLTAIELLMRYRGIMDTVKHEVKLGIDWDSMTVPHANPEAAIELADDEDPIEQRIKALELLEEEEEE